VRKYSYSYTCGTCMGTLDSTAVDIQGHFFCKRQHGQKKRDWCRERFRRVLEEQALDYFESELEGVIPALEVSKKIRSPDVKDPEFFPFEAHEAFRNAQIVNGRCHPVLREIGGEEPELLEQVLKGDASGLQGREIQGQEALRRFLGKRGSEELIILPFAAYESWWEENGRNLESGADMNSLAQQWKKKGKLQQLEWQ